MHFRHLNFDRIAQFHLLLLARFAQVFTGSIMPTLASIQIGRPQSLPADASQPLSNKPWRTAFYKTPIDGRVDVGLTGIEGDGQADLKHHGGVDKAICVYSVEHFEHWRSHLNREEFGAGGFGENFSVAGIEESDVAIGDRWQIGTVTFEISQPRQPCLEARPSLAGKIDDSSIDQHG